MQSGLRLCRTLCLVFVLAPGVARALPLAFEPNRGQTDPRVRFLARGSGFQFFLTETEAVYRLGDDVVRMRLVGAGAANVRGVKRLPSKSHYLDRLPSVTHVPHFARVELEDVYRGIHLAYYGSDEQLEYDFHLSPGADPRVIEMEIDGSEGMSVGRLGELRIRTGAGEMVWKAPVAYQDSGLVKASYVVRGKNRFGFRIGRFDRGRPLVIDPVLAYSTTVGGSSLESVNGIAVDASGEAVIAGSTASADFPATAGSYPGTARAAFVAKLNAAGNGLVYSTFLGPGEATDVALLGGNAYVAGTAAPNMFVKQLTSDGSAVVYSNVFGPVFKAGGIAVDSSGNAYVTGTTSSNNFPTTAGAFQPIRPTHADPYQGDMDAFFVKLDASGSTMLYSTYLGSSLVDEGLGIAIDANGHAYVAGATQGRASDWYQYPDSPPEPAAAVPFPTTAGAYRETFSGGASAFLTRFDPAATGAASVVYSTLLGPDNVNSTATGVAVDLASHAYVTGSFMMKVDPAGSQIVYAGAATGSAIALDSANNAFVVGRVTVSGSVKYQLIELDGGGLVHHSFDVDGWDTPPSIAVDPSGAAFVGGQLFTSPLNTDGLVAKVVMHPPPERFLNVNLYGSASGRVTSTDGKIDCASGTALSCAASYALPSQVTLVATPGTGAVFSGWGGSCSGTADCVLTMTSDHFVQAHFDARQVTLSVAAPANGKITSADGIDCGTACSIVRPYGTTVALTAAADYGFLFDGWTGDCAGTSGTTCSLTLDLDRSAGAVFKEIPTALTAISVAPASATIAFGGRQAFTATGTFSDGSSRRISSEHSFEASDYDNCLITTNGLVKCWGRNSFPTPTAVQPFEKAVALSAGTNHFCALFDDGTVNCWEFGGAGTTNCSGPVAGITSAVDIASEAAAACALLADGSVWCWSLGGVPQATGIIGAVSIGAEGGSPACAVLSGGTVQCLSDFAGTPLAVIPGVSDAVAVTVGSEHACVLIFDGTVKCFGRNQYGQLGDGTVNSGYQQAGTVVDVANAVNVVSGDYYTCAMLSDGTVKCWGMQINADHSITPVPTPSTVPNITNPVAVAAGAFHACASFDAGNAQCWGSNVSQALVQPAGLNNALALRWSASNSAARMMSSGLALGDAPGTVTVTSATVMAMGTASLSVVNTPTGTNVTVPVASDVSLTFTSILSAGQTTAISSGSGPASPSGFELGNPPLYYDITTTAAYAGPVQVCIRYQGVSFGGSPRLFHYENGVWQDVTTSVDAAAMIVCGIVTTLSPFALFSPIDTAGPVIGSIAANPNVLWPPDRKMVDVHVTVLAADASPPVRCRITGVTGNDAMTRDDWEVLSDTVVRLRAERSGKDGSRIYRVGVKCSDALGNTSTGNAGVVVPHDRRGG